MIPVIDVRLKFDMEPKSHTDRRCIIIVEISGLSGSIPMGVVVDRVYDVSEIKDEETQDSPQFGPEVNTEFILGMAENSEGVIILLDIDQILHGEDMIQMAQARQTIFNEIIKSIRSRPVGAPCKGRPYIYRAISASVELFDPFNGIHAPKVLPGCQHLGGPSFPAESGSPHQPRRGNH